MRLSGTKTGSINQYRGLGDQLWDLGGARPTLDLNFAHSKSLVDATTGSNLVDFTRASSGTYVGSDGLIKTATTNLLTYSEEFDQSPWSAVRASIENSTELAPNGSSYFKKLREDATPGLSHFVNATVPISQGAPFVFSLYVKAGERLGARLRIADNISYLEDIVFNASTGAITNDSNSNDIEPIGNGVYRVWIACVPNATATSASVSIEIWNFDEDSQGYDGDGTSGLYLWGAQLEQSDTVGEYVKTTSTINSAPRFDHDPTTGESLGLLVEESRTNLLLQSENFSTTWGGPGTIDANAAVAPDGTLTADTITTATNAVKSQTSQSFAAGSTLTVSVFAKKNVTNFLRLEVANSVSCWYDLDTGAVGTNTAGSGNVLFSAKSIQSYPNGWYRCILTLTTSTVTTASVLVFATTNDNQGTSGGESIHIWGAQLEAGSFATSYIPTTTATVTRAADVASITGSNFSSWYRQDEGTVFADSTPQSGTGFMGFNDGTTSNRIRLSHTGTTASIAVNVAGGVLQFSINSGPNTFPINTRGKSALAMKAGDFALTGNGSSVATSTGLMPSLDRATIGTAIGVATPATINGTIRRLCYWSQRLPDSTLVNITT